MPDAGDWVTPQLAVAPYDGSTLATLAVTAPDGSVTSPTPSTGDGGQTWTTQIQYSAAGEWLLEWTVTGTGAGYERQTVQVAPGPDLTGRTYATTTQLANWLQAAPPEGARRLLRQATRLVDRALLTAVYDVDEDGMPTDADVAQALADATCAQVEDWGASGDELNHSARWTSATIGNASYSRNTAPNAPTSRLSERALDVLISSGLLPGHITTAGGWPV